MRTVAFLIAASPNDAFYSQIAAISAALRCLDWVRWRPSVHVFVGGEPVLRDGRLVRIDQDAVMREVVKTGARITGRLNMSKVLKLRWPVE